MFAECDAKVSGKRPCDGVDSAHEEPRRMWIMSQRIMSIVSSLTDKSSGRGAGYCHCDGLNLPVEPAIMVGMSHSEENISESVADCLEVHLERFDQIFAALDAGHRVDSQDAHTTLHDAPLDVTVHRRLTALLADGEPLGWRLPQASTTPVSSVTPNSSPLGGWRNIRMRHLPRSLAV